MRMYFTTKPCSGPPRASPCAVLAPVAHLDVPQRSPNLPCLRGPHLQAQTQEGISETRQVSRKLTLLFAAEVAPRMRPRQPMGRYVLRKTQAGDGDIALRTRRLRLVPVSLRPSALPLPGRPATADGGPRWLRPAPARALLCLVFIVSRFASAISTISRSVIYTPSNITTARDCMCT